MRLDTIRNPLNPNGPSRKPSDPSWSLNLLEGLLLRPEWVLTREAREKAFGRWH